jgi:hypothetical protein
MAVAHVTAMVARMRSGGARPPKAPGCAAPERLARAPNLTQLAAAAKECAQRAHVRARWQRCAAATENGSGGDARCGGGGTRAVLIATLTR